MEARSTCRSRRPSSRPPSACASTSSACRGWSTSRKRCPPIPEDTMPAITPMLWFDKEAEEAARFYVSVFPNSKITTITRYGEAGPGAKGSVMTVNFELDGEPFTALNGGPLFKFNESVSYVIHCKD